MRLPSVVGAANRSRLLRFRIGCRSCWSNSLLRHSLRLGLHYGGKEVRGAKCPAFPIRRKTSRGLIDQRPVMARPRKVSFSRLAEEHWLRTTRGCGRLDVGLRFDSFRSSPWKRRRDGGSAAFAGTVRRRSFGFASAKPCNRQSFTPPRVRVTTPRPWLLRNIPPQYHALHGNGSDSPR